MDDKKKKSKRDKLNVDGKPNDEDIPLWLQGLEETEGAETSPIEIEKDIKSEWVKEISDGSTGGKESPLQENDTQATDHILPDWLSEIPYIDPGAPAISNTQVEALSEEPTEVMRSIQDDLIESEAGGEGGAMYTEEIEGKFDEIQDEVPSYDLPEIAEIPFEEITAIKTPDTYGEVFDEHPSDENPELLDEALEEMLPDETPESVEEVVDESFMEIPDLELLRSFDESLEESSLDEIEGLNEESLKAFAPEKEFIELSESNLNDFSDLEKMIPDEEISEDEKLPPWLEDMIAEPSEPVVKEMSFSESDIEEQNEEPTQPVKISLEDVVSEDAFIDGVSVEALESETFSPDTLQEVEIPEVVTEIDKTPMIDLEDSTEVEGPLGWIAEEVPAEGMDIPDTLHEVKVLLGQGSYSEAVKMINNDIKEPTFLDEIQIWLKDVAAKRAHHNCDVWEMIGDIALRQEKSQEAFRAYAKAINILLTGDKEFDEID